MEIDKTLYTLIMLAFIFAIGVISYNLGKRKTTTPKITALMGVMLAAIPPLGIIYVVLLFFRKDLPAKSEQVK